MDLVTRINEDMKSFMKSQDKEKLGVIRIVKGAMQLKKLK